MNGCFSAVYPAATPPFSTPSSIRVPRPCASSAQACPARFSSAAMSPHRCRSPASPGLFSAVDYAELFLQLQPGDSVLVFTDGLTDARNLHDEEFGPEGIRDVCRRHAGESPLDLLGHLFRSIQSFTAHCKQWDDMTAAFFHYSGR